MSDFAFRSPTYRPMSWVFAAGLKLSSFVMGIFATALMLDAHAELGVISAFACFAMVIIRIPFERFAEEHRASVGERAKET